AHHVADDANCNLTIGGTDYTALERIYNNDADLALVRYDTALPGFYNYTTSSSFANSEVIMIGFGYYGEVTQGVTNGSWDQQYAENPDVIRWGTNTVDGLATITDAFGDTYSTLKTTISGTNPSQDPTTYETGVNTGDSGGGMFAKVSDEWTLIGINAYRGPETSPYDSTYSVPVLRHLDHKYNPRTGDALVNGYTGGDGHAIGPTCSLGTRKRHSPRRHEEKRLEI
ncbi:MAG: hypothetical protein GWP14_10850, partial [Actinobacteria bacterium]|nr:hypothetical protein [Actinomycetota bacterium]